MSAITDKEIAAAYELAKAREQGGLTEAVAIGTLSKEFGMNRSSANDYVDAYRHMRKGEVFKRTLSAAGASYYLEHIREDFGPGSALLALKSLDRHIAYYEPIRGAQCLSLRKVADAFRSRVIQAKSDELLRLQVDLEAAVAASMKMPSERRRAKLPAPGHKPSTITVTTAVYVRNPAVIAEVLLRAGGVCEACGKPAPFIRKVDQTPYLEVHHKRRLADGGDDTVENAQALCPNCHRERHFGASLTRPS